MISLRCPSVWPMARLTRRMNEVAFMPKAISSGRRAFRKARHALARTADGRIHGDALRVAPAALHVVLEQVLVHRIQHPLRHLRPGGVVEENEGAGPLQRGKLRAQRLGRKRHAARRVAGDRCTHGGSPSFQSQFHWARNDT